MRFAPRLFRVVAMALPFALSGCLWHTRKLPIPKPPASIETVAPDELVTQLNDRWEKLQTLTATVEIQAQKIQQGTQTDYTSFRGFIILRKPGHMRVVGLMPIIGTTMFDMATDGNNFWLYMPPKNKVIQGSNQVQKKSENQFENLRPDFFYDAMIVRGLDPEDNFSRTGDTEIVEDASKKHLIITPEYILNITKPNANSHQETPVRVIEFHREDMLPYEQDLYDEQGTLTTHVTYSNYQKYDFGMYPQTITIKRPIENVQLVLTVQKVTENTPLGDDQFKPNWKAGTPVEELK